ncbi:hypothetical protein CRUP_027089, partial [Coryphaenoides rupestris]
SPTGKQEVNEEEDEEERNWEELCDLRWRARRMDLRGKPSTFSADGTEKPVVGEEGLDGGSLVVSMTAAAAAAAVSAVVVVLMLLLLLLLLPVVVQGKRERWRERVYCHDRLAASSQQSGNKTSSVCSSCEKKTSLEKLHNGCKSSEKVVVVVVASAVARVPAEMAGWRPPTRSKAARGGSRGVGPEATMPPYGVAPDAMFEPGDPLGYVWTEPDSWPGPPR